MVIIITVCAGTGLKATITQNIKNAESDIQISNINQKKETESISITQDELTLLNTISEIKTINPVITKSGIINNENNIQPIILKGIEQEYKEKIIENYIIAGSYFTEKEENQILISNHQAKKLGLSQGETCLLYFLSQNNNIQKRKFFIIGIYDMKNEFFNENYSFAKKVDLQKINKWNHNEVTNYEITLNNSSKTEKIVLKINNILSYKLKAKSLKQRFPGIFNWVKLFDKNIIVILIIMCVICIINLSNTLFILILERLKMIGTLKSFGCSNISIMKVFLYNSLKLSIKGILAGNTIGLLFCLIQEKTHIISLNPNSYFVDYLPIIINIEFILYINLIIFIIIQISIIAPYYIIKKLSPSTILKIT
jgi:lipoprotein-releasing system permease protein